MFELLLFGSVILCIFIALLLYSSNAHGIIKLLTLPYTILLCAVVIWSFIKLTGAPIKAYPEGTWAYINHTVEQDGTYIVLWARVESLSDHRLYKFPYDRETAKKLNQAKSEQTQTTTHKGNFKQPRFGEPGVLYIEKHNSKTENAEPKK